MRVRHLPSGNLQLPSSKHLRQFTASVMHSAEFWVQYAAASIYWRVSILAAIFQRVVSVISIGAKRTTAIELWKFSSHVFGNLDHSVRPCIILLCAERLRSLRRIERKGSCSKRSLQRLFAVVSLDCVNLDHSKRNIAMRTKTYLNQ